MITVIDQIAYLPKSNQDLKSQAYNAAAKGAFDLIKKKLSAINTKGKSAKVVISGRVSKHGTPLEMNMQITQCSDNDLLQTIQQVLGMSRS